MYNLVDFRTVISIYGLSVYSDLLEQGLFLPSGSNRSDEALHEIKGVSLQLMG